MTEILGKCKVCNNPATKESIVKDHKGCFEQLQKEAIIKHLKCIQCFNQQSTCNDCQNNLKKLGMV